MKSCAGNRALDSARELDWGRIDVDGRGRGHPYRASAGARLRSRLNTAPALTVTVPGIERSFQRALARYSSGFDALCWQQEQTLATAVHVSPLRPILTIVTLSCAGECADAMAVATGGYSPYSFAWENGSTDPQRRVCPTASTSYHLSVSDSGTRSGEFSRPAQTIQVPLTAEVLDCSDAGTRADADAPAETGTDTGVDADTRIDANPSTDSGSCDSSTGIVVEELMPDIFGTPAFFAGGAPLPAGHYEIAYVDGCLQYDLFHAWTVNGLVNPQYWIIGVTTVDQLTPAPGIQDLFGYTSFEACVAANRGASVWFQFPGGKLGIWQNDFSPGNNRPGEGRPKPEVATHAVVPMNDSRSRRRL
jgi:hypothetical protein